MRWPKRGRRDAEHQLGGDRAQPPLAPPSAPYLQALFRLPGQVLRVPLRGQRLRGLQGFLPPQHPEEHGVHVPPGQELHHQQGDAQPVPVLPPPEVLRSRHVQGV
ncbi:hypothetical protein AV530_010259 [Patagioenas fasciata monilis]|uniref:Uncharacterized protein n=1 Tax=Patagioenas fasciata monilis TaxID=372326 RepID=A0A1V4JSX3_PATFA|nr:hypothetical protein AV530_010259 [Patagioenas fasciata monilis]